MRNFKCPSCFSVVVALVGLLHVWSFSAACAQAPQTTAVPTTTAPSTTPTAAPKGCTYNKEEDRCEHNGCTGKCVRKGKREAGKPVFWCECEDQGCVFDQKKKKGERCSSQSEEGCTWSSAGHRRPGLCSEVTHPKESGCYCKPQPVRRGTPNGSTAAVDATPLAEEGQIS
jgi:hypothetical protein